MRPSLDDLTSSQRSLLYRMDPDVLGAEAIGCELEQLTDAEVIDAHEMIVLGLVEIETGWRDTQWFTLTRTGCRLRQEGEPG